VAVEVAEQILTAAAVAVVVELLDLRLIKQLAQHQLPLVEVAEETVTAEQLTLVTYLHLVEVAEDLIILLAKLEQMVVELEVMELVDLQEQE
jgi:hypothetical protein